MKHLGDITKINGAEIEPVGCIIGGSLCARDYKGVGNQFVEEGKLIIEHYDMDSIGTSSE